MSESPHSKPSMQRPYLLRAMHEWMTDNALTPHIVVDATRNDLVAPSGYAKDGKLVLNVSYDATRGLELGNELIRFEARFGGMPHRIEIPVDAVLGIYARESGRGMLFPAEEGAEPPDGRPPEGGGPKGGPPEGGSRKRGKAAQATGGAARGEPKKPALKVVK
jgi:stringent starvation protein B